MKRTTEEIWQTDSDRTLLKRISGKRPLFSVPISECDLSELVELGEAIKEVLAIERPKEQEVSP